MYKRPRELERKQLDNALSEVMEKPLFIITAPSGFGKTTLAKIFFLKHPEITNFWLLLEHAEQDEAWVWSKICELFIGTDMKLYQALHQLGIPKTNQEIDYFISIVREHIKQPVCFVLDDYHESNGPLMNQLIERVVYEEIPNLHIMIISRVYPDIPCEEMLLKGYCTTIDQQMLSLSKEESIEVFRINNIELKPEEAEKMYEYTDGWIAAVYLALYDYNRVKKFENLSNIDRLLKKAIFEKLSDTIQELYMKMSIFEKFTVEEACYVLQKEIHENLLLQTQEQFGFILYDANTGSYMMHSLLRNVAREKLEESNIDKNNLYRRCGEYREYKGDYIGAVLCYRNAGDSERILNILSGEKRSLIYEQIPALLKEIFREIPLDIRLKYPTAYLGYIYHLILMENANNGKALYEEAAVQYAEIYKDKALHQDVAGEILILESLLDFNDIRKMTDKLKMAYEKLEHQSSIFEQSIMTFGVPSMCSLFYSTSGELKETVKILKEYAEYHMRLTRGISTGWSELFEAEYAFILLDIPKAEELSKKVTERAQFIKTTCIIISSYFVRIRCLIYQGKEKETYELLAELEQQMKDISRPMLITDYELACGYIYACIGRLDKIAPWVSQFQFENCNRVVRNVRSGCVAYGMIQCKLKKWVLVDAIAEEILTPYEATNHVYIIVCGYILKAAATLNLEGMEKARKYLMKAVEMAEPDNLKITFVEMGAYIQPIIEDLKDESEFCKSLAAPIKKYINSLRAFAETAKQTVLSKREEELMGYVKEGLRNVDISNQMHIALVTVEKNLTNIYRKLNVSNRAAAIAKMEELYQQ